MKKDWSCEIPRFQGNREATMSIMEVSLLTGFYPNQNDLKQVTEVPPARCRTGWECPSNIPQSPCGHGGQGPKVSAPWSVAMVTSDCLPA